MQRLIIILALLVLAGCGAHYEAMSPTEQWQYRQNISRSLFDMSRALQPAPIPPRPLLNCIRQPGGNMTCL